MRDPLIKSKQTKSKKIKIECLKAQISADSGLGIYEMILRCIDAINAVDAKKDLPPEFVAMSKITEPIKQWRRDQLGKVRDSKTTEEIKAISTKYS